MEIAPLGQCPVDDKAIDNAFVWRVGAHQTRAIERVEPGW